ncbi:hypothetical protein CMQ_348 [Grosmannia clavigera kw1407]|uniref:Uncharacterized protein n=1 Tax=Grosmannia clavigera (strain kw1407 / UAMH 11150) TaxID=655863 RepID=F0XQL9_GROCL|nr:uncharacterized protein CMQ_348 [Grosmannia clavigera kw1407]EFX00031.1 hypothetical protein CMQ_348 [Grosmannia clavigera kw1407]
MIKFNMGLNRRMRQYFICLVAIIVVILYVLALTGCLGTSPGIPGIYLVRYFNNVTEAEVRVGLFGLCAGTAGNLTCAATIGHNGTVANTIASGYTLPGSAANTAAPSDLQAMLALATTMQGSTATGQTVVSAVFVPLIVGCVFFVTAVCALLAHGALNEPKFVEEDGACYESVHRTRAWQVVGVVTTYSVAASLAAAIATTAAGRALLFAGSALPGAALTAAQAASRDTIQAQTGTALPVLQWLVVTLTLMWHLLMTFVWRKM